MNDQTDQQLLRDYADHKSEAAFVELVRRYVDLIHSAALRMVCDAHAAKDVTQDVFVLLVQNARQLTDRPALAGWLHCTARNLAAKAVRTDVRRRAREQEAVTMNQLLSANPDANWEHVAPHLDDALGALDDTDRDAVLLRYFKNHGLRTVGATLGISDDAAQKRVSRAVERLREFFAKRGVTVGAGGLAVVISANAVQAAPVGLALTIATAAALTGTTLATAATVTATKAIAMTALQKIIVAATITVLAGVGIYENRQAAGLRQQVQTLQQERSDLTARLDELESMAAEQSAPPALAKANQPLPGSSNDLLRLRGEVARLRRETEESKSPITHDTVTTRYKHAQELARNGDTAAALKEFLWCYDVGMRQVPSFAGVRSSYVLSSIAKLGESNPEALAALRERRDQALQRILTSENDPQAGLDYAALNRTLNEEPNLLVTFDQLPPDDSRRKALAEVAYDQFIAAQRYSDALLGRSYEKINLHFDMGKMEIPLPANTPNLEQIRQNRRDRLIKSTVKDVEVLAGTGDLAHARTMAERLLAYDSSPGTADLLNQHLTRAGQPDLLAR